MIQVQFETTPADIQAFQKFAASLVRGFTSKASLGFSWRSMVLGVPVGILLFIAAKLLRFTFHMPTALVLAGVFLAFWWWASWSLARATPPAERGAFLVRRQVSLDENGIREQSAEHKHYSTWQGVLSVEETPDHVFLMIDRFAGYIVPKRAFSDAAQLGEFVAFARKHASA